MQTTKLYRIFRQILIILLSQNISAVFSICVWLATHDAIKTPMYFFYNNQPSTLPIILRKSLYTVSVLEYSCEWTIVPNSFVLCLSRPLLFYCDFVCVVSILVKRLPTLAIIMGVGYWVTTCTCVYSSRFSDSASSA